MFQGQSFRSGGVHAPQILTIELHHLRLAIDDIKELDGLRTIGFAAKPEKRVAQRFQRRHTVTPQLALALDNANRADPAGYRPDNSR